MAEVLQKLDCVCLHTDELDRSLQFYAEMGLREAWRLERTTEAGVPWTLIGLGFPQGGAQLVLSTHPDRRAPEIEIRVEDVHETFRTLSARGDITWIAAPFAIENGHVAVMVAPDGNAFVLIGR